MHEKLQELTNYFLFGTGATTGVIGISLTNIDLGMGLLLKFVSLASFICFLLINQDKIQQGWIKFINRFKRNKK